MRDRPVLVLAVLALLGSLAACTVNGSNQADPARIGASGSPSPSGGPEEPSPDPSARPAEEGQGWLVRAENAYLTASTRICSFEQVLTAAELDDATIYLDVSGGLPDDWTPEQPYQVDNNGVSLNLLGGTYFAKRFDGDLTTGIGDVWETANAPLEVRRDAFGVVSGGSGSGTTTFISRNGDVSSSTDRLTFTVERIPDPPWCDIP